ncbi:MAG: dephospho-CoA kinase [Sulfitobacter sp.]
MFLLGLTGSIGMGKSTTAQMFADAGCAVWDADAAVHRLYAKGGAAVPGFAKALPEAVIDGAVSRPALKQMIAKNPAVLRQIETLVHPLVAKDRADFIAAAQAEIIVLDIPLLFETGGDAQMHATACVLIDAEEQERRVLARGTMDRDQFLAIRAKQMPAAQKAARADYVITTDTVENARKQVQGVIADIRKKLTHA